MTTNNELFYVAQQFYRSAHTISFKESIKNSRYILVKREESGDVPIDAYNSEHRAVSAATILNALHESKDTR
tara:strand:+ start:2563 stop:2778 length:216 start_codon:yes stop_codon:yes gene_type:complete